MLAGGCLTSAMAAFAFVPARRAAAQVLLGEKDMWDRLRHACAWLGRSDLSRRLGMAESWATVSSEVAGALRARGHGYDDDEGSGLLLFGCAGLCVLLTIVSLSPLGIFVGIASCAVGVLLRANAQKRRQRQELAREMPDVFRSLAVSLGSGKTLPQAIEYVGTHERGPVGVEFGKAAMSIRCGVSVAEALEGLSRSLDAPGTELLATALSISQRTGSPLRDLLLSSAKMVEGKTELDRTLVTKTAQARLSARIVCVLPILMVAILSMLSPEFRGGVLAPQGMACLAVALVLDGIAVLLIRRLMGSVST